MPPGGYLFALVKGTRMLPTTTDKVAAPPVELLRLYHDRLREIDESVRDLTNFFFTLNSLLIGLFIQFAKDDAQRLVLAVLGYVVAVAIQCITYKGYLSWQLPAG